MQQNDPAFFPTPVLVIAGLGLLGGAVALAARQRGLARKIVALGRRPEDLAEAQRQGVIDEFTTNAHEAYSQASFVVLCQPVEIIEEVLPEVLATVPAGCVVTDVGSTKETIVAAGGRHERSDVWFVGSHPMAGSDRTGWRAARADLFDGASTFVTVTPGMNLCMATRVGRFWSQMGSRVLYSAARRHDNVVALLSHVPHLAAVALMEQLHRSGEDPGLLRVLAGTGLRDTTRIAKGSPELWEQICLQNARPVAEMLDAVGSRFHELAKTIREGDQAELRQALARARDLRVRIDGD